MRVSKLGIGVEEVVIRVLHFWKGPEAAVSFSRHSLYVVCSVLSLFTGSLQQHIF